jgi:very-short-patch-repair endonuclease
MDVLELVDRYASRTQGLLTPSMLRNAGVAPAVLSRAAADGRLVLVRRRVYAAAPLPELPRHLLTADGPADAFLAQARAVLLSLGGGACARLRTAALLHGWPVVVEPRVLEVAVPRGRGGTGMRGVRCTQPRELDAVLVRCLPGTEPLRVTSPLRTVLDAARKLPLVETVVLCDSALRTGAVQHEELLLAVGSRLRRLRQVALLADPRSGSVLESLTRMRLVQAGLLGFETQVTVRRGGQSVRVDFLYERERLVVEVDGERWHQDVQRDRERDNLLVAAGYRVPRFTWPQVVHAPDEFIATMTAALGRTGSVRTAHRAAARAA